MPMSVRLIIHKKKKINVWMLVACASDWYGATAPLPKIT